MRKLPLIAVACGLWSATASAAPFCVRTESYSQCIYHDPAQCQRDAAHQGNAECTTNPDEIKAPTAGGGAAYCVVTADRVSICQYADYVSCQREAVRYHGACTAAANSSPIRPPNPYNLQQ